MRATNSWSSSTILVASRPPTTPASGALRPAVIQRKVTNGYRAMWAAEGEAAVRTVVDTERLTGASPFGTILKTVSA